MEDRKAIIPDWNVTRKKRKLDIDYVFRNDHKIKTTQPTSMILVSIFLEDNHLSDEIEKCYIL